MTRKELFAEKLSHIQSELNGTKLLIVSKNRSVEEIRTYYDLGQRDFGENKVQELSEKAMILKNDCPEIRWHMIGHLQSNKIHQLYSVPNLFAIHSVHSYKLAEKLVSSENRLEQNIEIYLQLNTSHEDEKSGHETFEELLTSARIILESKKLKLTGLMTMGTVRTDDFESEARRCFKDLLQEKRLLESELGLSLKSSMGMSQDYKIAIEEKSDWIRLGTSMFSTAS